MGISTKLIIKSFVRLFGYDIVRYEPLILRPFDVLPFLVRERLSTADDFFFVQVGANDGVLDDPLRELITTHHLRGVLIEPLPDLFATLCENYKSEPQLLFERVAIAGREGHIPIYRVRKPAPVPAWHHGLASFEKSHLLNEGIAEEDIEQVAVETVTLRTLLDRHAVKKVHLLQVDTEGYDYQIVRSAIDQGILPDIINYEHCHLVPSVQTQCKRLLDANGYKFIEVGKDTLAVREPCG